MSLSQFAARLRALPDKLRQNLAAAERETQKQALGLAITLSSGTETSQSLRRAGHPYSRRSTDSAFAPFLINAQKGLFRAGWVAPTQVITGRTIHTSVLNLSEEAQWMAGTDRMVSRPIAKEVMRRIEPRRQKRIQDAIDKTLKDF